jgi:ADP-heptose:LPS heptosyltransferase
MYETCPYIDNVIGFEHNQSIGVLYKFSKDLRKEKYDLAIFSRFGASPWHIGLLLYWSGAKVRLTYRKSSRRKKYSHEGL